MNQNELDAQSYHDDVQRLKAERDTLLAVARIADAIDDEGLLTDTHAKMLSNVIRDAKRLNPQLKAEIEKR